MNFFKTVVNWHHGQPAGEPVDERFTLPNGLQLVVKSGDITKETAGGVVVGEDEDFTARGAIAQALLKAGGEDYKTYRDQLKEVVKNDRPNFLMYSTPAGKYLQYKYILHAMTSFNRKLPKNWVGHLKALFYEMGRVAEEKAFSDLVTPLLGIGKAAMPLDVSVQAAIHGLSMLQPRALKQVTILEYDRKKAETIRDNVRRILASNGTSTDHAQSNGVKDGRRTERTEGWTESGTERTRSFSSYDIISLPSKNERSRIPDGKMVVSTKPQLQLQGFPDCGTILIEYSFPNGTQGPHHPAPGQPYKGTFRRAYLPDNQEGRRVLDLLQKAFDRDLTFQLVQSGPDQEWRVEFADIPHKTSLRGGPKGHGFPDPSYMVTVRAALAEHRLDFGSQDNKNNTPLESASKSLNIVNVDELEDSSSSDEEERTDNSHINVSAGKTGTRSSPAGWSGEMHGPGEEDNHMESTEPWGSDPPVNLPQQVQTWTSSSLPDDQNEPPSPPLTPEPSPCIHRSRVQRPPQNDDHDNDNNDSSEALRDGGPEVPGTLQKERPPSTPGGDADHDAGCRLLGQRKRIVKHPAKTDISERRGKEVSAQQTSEKESPVPANRGQRKSKALRDGGPEVSVTLQEERPPSTPGGDTDHDTGRRFLGQRKIKAHVPREDAGVSPQRAPPCLDPALEGDQPQDSPQRAPPCPDPALEGDLPQNASVSHQRAPPCPNPALEGDLPQDSPQRAPSCPDPALEGDLPQDNPQRAPSCPDPALEEDLPQDSATTTGGVTEVRDQTTGKTLHTQSSERDPGTEPAARGQRKDKPGGAARAGSSSGGDSDTTDKETVRNRVGTMPKGRMNHSIKTGIHVPGHEGCGVIVVDYIVPDGIQQPEHPQPGSPYCGCAHYTFLPDTDQGRHVLTLLEEAFDRRLTFQVCVQPGGQALVEWADIPHKTCLRGPRERGGYPDPGYLASVQNLLREKYSIE